MPPYSKVIDYTRFCQTREEFHTQYGLSLNGTDPACISERSLSEADWLSVFTEQRQGSKVKLKHVRPELFETLIVLHQKVYQEVPLNLELSIVFAFGFAFEHSATAKQSTNKGKFQVAWAIAAEAHVERCRQKGTLQQKIQRFYANLSSVKNTNTSPSMHQATNYSFQTRQRATECFMSDSERVNVTKDQGVVLLSTLHERLEMEKGRLSRMKADLDEAKLAAATESKFSTVVTELRKKLHSARTELERREDLDDRRKIQLETQVQMLSDNLDLLGCNENHTDRVPEVQVVY